MPPPDSPKEPLPTSSNGKPNASEPSRLVLTVVTAAPFLTSLALGNGAGAAEEAAAASEEATSEAEVGQTVAGWDSSKEPWAPRKQLRSCVASMADSKAFARMVAAEAQERDFYRAQRKAFVADGSAYNWKVQRTHFADFEPIVDFLHVLCYVYAAAWAVEETPSARWDQYVWQSRWWVSSMHG
jgi:hypothetical protein